jgi:hypothetical protein
MQIVLSTQLVYGVFHVKVDLILKKLILEVSTVRRLTNSLSLRKRSTNLLFDIQIRRRALCWQYSVRVVIIELGQRIVYRRVWSLSCILDQVLLGKYC